MQTNTRQQLKNERKEEKDGLTDRHHERREKFKLFMAEKYFDGDEDAVGAIPRIPITSKRFTNRFAVDILRRDGYLTERQSKSDKEAEGEEIRVKEPQATSAREEALDAVVEQLREQAKANIEALDV